MRQQLSDSISNAAAAREARPAARRKPARRVLEGKKLILPRPQNFKSLSCGMVRRAGLLNQQRETGRDI
jgi:hypothetical protein